MPPSFGLRKDHTQIQGHHAPPSEEPPARWRIVDMDTGEELTPCPTCGFLYRPGDWPLCRGEGGPAAHSQVTMLKFSEFEFDADEGPVRITSIAQVRKLERESMERYRAGAAGDPKFKGSRPYVFRQYSQDPSNKTKPIELVANPERTPKKRTKRGIPFVHPSYRMRKD